MRYSKAVCISIMMMIGMFLCSTYVAGQTPKKGGTLTVAINLDFQTLDPQSTTVDPTPEAMVNVFEGLYAYGKKLTPAPELAESYEMSGDKMTWTFTLRKGVLFHNGKEMTSEDVKASLERYVKVSPGASHLKDLKEIKALGKYMIQLVFVDPIGLFLLSVLADDMTKAVIMPKEIAEVSKQGSLTQIIGTGPYQFVEYRPDNYLKLKRFEKYVSRTDPPNYQTGRKVGYPDYIIFKIVPEASTRVAGLSTGEFDIIRALPDVEYERVKKDEKLVPIISNPALLDRVHFNCQKGPFANIDMRRAVQALVDVEEVCRSMVSRKEFYQVDPSLMSQISAYHNTAGAEYFNQRNLQKAKELMKKAGYKGETIKFLALHPDPINYRACVAVAEQMKAAGMNVELLQYDIGTWVAKRRDPDGMHMFETQPALVDASFYRTYFGGKWPGEKVACSFPDITDILGQLASENDFQNRFELTKKLQILIYQNVAFVPVGYHHRAKARRVEIMDPEGNLRFDSGPMHHVWINR